MRKKYKINPVSTLLTMILTIILEKIVSPYLEGFIGWISSKGFRITDYLYERIAKGVIVNIPFYIFLLLVVFASVYIINNKQDSAEPNSEDCKKTCKKKKCEHCIVHIRIIVKNIIADCFNNVSKWFILAVLWIFAVGFLTLSNFVNHNVVKINNNIGIVAVYIDDSKYKELKSNFYCMNKYEDYLLLQKEIQELADKNNIRLQE